MFGDNRIVRRLRIFAAAAVLVMTAVLGGSTVSYGEEMIKSVKVTVTSSVEADSDEGTVSAEANSVTYRVASCEFASSKGSWNAGETPKVNIELQAEEGYYFGSINAGKATVRGADYSTVRKGDDNHTIILVVKLKPVKGALGAVESGWWETSPLGKARWDKVDNAPAYELKLYCGDTMVYHVDKTTSTSYDFFPQMTVRGDYYFKVRAIAKTSADSEYLKAGEWTESTFQEITKRDAEAAEQRSSGNSGGGSNSGGGIGGVSGGPGASGNAPSVGGTAGSGGTGPIPGTEGWRQDRNGWWYQESDGTYPVNKWRLINNRWYLFDIDGYMLTGWQTKNGHEYYLTSNGDMVSGWFEYNRMWYYLDPQNGKYTGGWLQLGDDWYYMNVDGTMATRWIKSKGSWYYLDPANGKMVRNAVVENYYINPDGVWIP